MKVNLDVAELRIPTAKNELKNEEILSFDEFFSYDDLEFYSPMSPSMPTWFIIVFCMFASVHWIIVVALIYISFKLWLKVRDLNTKLIWVQSSLGLDEPPPSTN